MSVKSTRAPDTHLLEPIRLLGCLTIENEPISVSLARQFTKIALRAGGYGSEADTLVLAASELVTNAIVHSRTVPARPIHVRLMTKGPTTIRLEVHDSETQPPRRQPVNVHDESGRGLALVEALTTRWGVHLNGADKFVWCELETKGQGVEHR